VRRERLILVAIGALAVVVRLPGLTTSGLWRDDAWTALGSRESLGTAVRMGSTAPGFTLLERLWIGFHPGSSLWAQMLPLGLGLLGVVATYAVLRFHGLRAATGLLGAFLVATSPVAVQYSTRVKEYSADLILACLLLWLGERVRRSPSMRTTGGLAVASALAVLISASTAPVIAGVWACVVLLGIRERTTIWSSAAAGGPLAVFLGGLYFFRLRHLPRVLHNFWAADGSFVDRSSVVGFWTSLGHIWGHLGVGLLAAIGHVDTLGAPIGPTGVVFVTTLALVALMMVGLTAGARGQAAALTILVAICASVAGAIPLGTGRTDEAIYPPILLLAGLGCEEILRPLRSRLGQRRSDGAHGAVPTGITVALVAMSLLSVVVEPPSYPKINVRALAAYVAAHQKPADRMLVDPYDRYTWALYVERAAVVRFGSDWGAGFTVVTDSVDTFICPSEPWEVGFKPTAWASRMTGAGRVWYVGAGRLSTAEDPIYRALLADGWHRQSIVDYTGGFVVLLTRNPTPVNVSTLEG
jgi:hypothetical protein